MTRHCKHDLQTLNFAALIAELVRAIDVSHARGPLGSEARGYVEELLIEINKRVPAWQGEK